LSALIQNTIFFCEEKIQKMMLNILFVYAKEHPDMGYKQGMHELLAPLLYLYRNEKMKKSDNDGDDFLLSELMDEEHMEHDTYMLFETIMKQAGEWFINIGPKQVQKAKGEVVTVQQDSPVLIKCRNIFLNLLKAKDPGLYTYINTLKIEPQVYLLRWIRLLFGREFRLEETLQIWDAIFSYDRSFSLVDYIAVAMLISVREQLLATDYSGVLQTLFKFPTTLPICTYINNALNIANPKRRKATLTTVQSSNNHEVGGVGSPSSPLPGKVTNSSPQSIGNVIGGVISGVIGGSLTQNGSHYSDYAYSKKRISEAESQRTLQLFVASRLSNVIDTLQEGLFENDKVMPLLSDKVLLGVAELKQLKDILMGHIPPESISGTPISTPTQQSPALPQHHQHPLQTEEENQ